MAAGVRPVARNRPQVDDARPGERLDGPARVARFLEGSEARQRFEQEAKVLRQLLASDAGLYVIDAREPVLAKYRDELSVLASCGKPLLPVLNFVSNANPNWPCRPRPKCCWRVRATRPVCCA